MPISLYHENSLKSSFGQVEQRWTIACRLACLAGTGLLYSSVQTGAANPQSLGIKHISTSGTPCWYNWDGMSTFNLSGLETDVGCCKTGTDMKYNWCKVWIRKDMIALYMAGIMMILNNLAIRLEQYSQQFDYMVYVDKFQHAGDFNFQFTEIIRSSFYHTCYNTYAPKLDVLGIGILTKENDKETSVLSESPSQQLFVHTKTLI